MKKFAWSRRLWSIFVPAILLALMIFWASAPDVEAQLPIRQALVPSSINPVGSGARAIGMGGAFIGVADDATAASWNPGGLIQLERPEVSMVGTWFQRTEDIDSSEHPEASENQSVSGTDLNYLSAAYPFHLLNRNMIVSLNYQNLYDFTRHWEFPISIQDAQVTTTQQVDSKQAGSYAALGLAYGLQISPTVSAGLTLNFWDEWLGSGEWEHDITISGSGNYMGIPFDSSYHRKDTYSINGFNVNLGVMWNISEKWNFGAVVKTPFEADLDHETTEQIDAPPPLIPDIAIPEYRKLNMPLSYGIGLAYRFSDRLTASLDLYRTEWDGFYLTDTDGNKVSPITGKPEGESDVDATHQVRAGLEYLHLTNRFIIPVRGGIFYDPAPAEGSPDQFYGFSIGSGVARGKLVFDLAYQYRFGNDVGSYDTGEVDFSEDVREHTVYASLILHF